MKLRKRSGFTMVQLIVAITVFVIISAAAFMALDPASRIGAAKEQRRRSDVLLIAKAFTEYAKDHQGTLPIVGEISNWTYRNLCTTEVVNSNCGPFWNQDCIMIGDKDFFDNYLIELPFDPDASDTNLTGYFIQRNINNEHLIFGSCNDTDIKKQTSIKYACNAYAGGYCWYADLAGGESCNTVCNDLGMDCVDNAFYETDYGIDAVETYCNLNKVFDPDNCGHDGCHAAEAAGRPPNISQDGCRIYEKPSSEPYFDCSYTSVGYNFCPCQ